MCPLYPVLFKLEAVDEGMRRGGETYNLVTKTKVMTHSEDVSKN